MQEQNSKESRDRSGPGAVRPDPQASEPPAWCFIYAAKVSSLCPGNGLRALDTMWRWLDLLTQAVESH